MRASLRGDRLTLISFNKLAKVSPFLHTLVQKGIEIFAPDGAAIEDLSRAEETLEQENEGEKSPVNYDEEEEGLGRELTNDNAFP